MAVENACVNASDPVLVSYASALLEGPALTWWYSVHRSPPGDTKWTWGTFQQSIRKAFRPIAPEMAARDKLDTLRQTNSVNAYAIQFRQTVSQIHDMAEADRVHRFI